MMRRKGFTLIELMVAMAIFVVLMYMAFSSLSFIGPMSRSKQNRETALEDMSTVLDQLTKELRQTLTSSGPGVEYPTLIRRSRDIMTISTPDPPLDSTYYSFGIHDTDPSDEPLNPILRFYMVDDNQITHRISYSLGVPTDSSGYKGISRQYWASQSFEPCDILYSNETGTGWANGLHSQPLTGQVITNFTVIRPPWSDNVIQVVIEAMVKNMSGGGSTKVSRVAQITLRQ